MTNLWRPRSTKKKTEKKKEEKIGAEPEENLAIA
jgi:hypothetical protein